MSQDQHKDQLARDTQTVGHRQLGIAGNLSKAAEILAQLSQSMEASDRDHAAIPTIREDLAYITRALDVLPAGIESLAASLQRASTDAREAAAISAELALVREEIEQWKKLRAEQAASEAELANMQALTLQMTRQITEMNAVILRSEHQ